MRDQTVMLTSSLMSWSVKRKVVPVPEGAVLRLQGRNTEVSPVTPVVRNRFFKSSKKLVEL